MFLHLFNNFRIDSTKIVYILIFLFSITFFGGCIMPKKNKLDKYKKRRDLSKSGEPKGEERGSTKGRSFVIQKHYSRNLHYDFRLSIGGVLVSWAVPKGPSMNPKVKRLAIRTDDHPIAYGRFEGVIPEGEYGAGTVMVWDRGTYKNIKEKDEKKISMEQSLKKGKIEVWLKGEKIKGGFALVKIQKKDQWLLIKMVDEHANSRANPVNTQNKSAITGRTMRQITSDSK